MKKGAVIESGGTCPVACRPLSVVLPASGQPHEMSKTLLNIPIREGEVCILSTPLEQEQFEQKSYQQGRR